MTISSIRLTPFYVVALALALPASAMAAGEASKPHDCDGDRKMQVSQPKDGVMEARVDDLTVQISVRENGPLRPADYFLRLSKGEQGLLSSSAAKSDHALPRACSLVAKYYKRLDSAQKAPSVEELRKQLSEVYDGL